MRGYSLPPVNWTALSAWSSNRSNPARGGRLGSHNGLSVAAPPAYTESHWQHSNNLAHWWVFKGLHWPWGFFPRIATVIHPKWPRKPGEISCIFVERDAHKHELTRVSCRLEEGKTFSVGLFYVSQKTLRISPVSEDCSKWKQWEVLKLNRPLGKWHNSPQCQNIVWGIPQFYTNLL